MSDQPTDVHLNPVKILHTLERVMSDDSLIVADGGDFVGTAAYILRSGYAPFHRIPFRRIPRNSPKTRVIYLFS